MTDLETRRRVGRIRAFTYLTALLLAALGVAGMAQTWPDDPGLDQGAAGIAWLCLLTGLGFAGVLAGIGAAVGMLARR